MKRFLASLLVVVALAFALATTAAAGGYEKDCGPYGVTGHIESDNVSCHKARKVIKGFYRKAQAQGPTVSVKGFACNGRIVKGSLQDIRCNRDGGRHRVHYRGSLGRADDYDRASSKPVVACAVAGHLAFKRTPRHCLIQKRGCPGTSACYVALERMKWNWGNRVAEGHGKRGFTMAGLFPVEVRLTKPVTKCGHTVFSKIKVTGDYAGEGYTDRAPLYTCPGGFP